MSFFSRFLRRLHELFRRSVQAQTLGTNAVGVQINGKDNTVIVYAGAARLTLVQLQRRRKTEPKTELELLRVDIRATTLVGRAADNEALDTWLAGDRPIAFRCLTARAGTGKTRLAVELCERAENAGWTAGFVQTVPFQTFIAHAADWRWTTPTLVVVDYAASFARDLRTWLEILAAGRYSDAPKLRVLLLERHADAELGWFADLLRITSFTAPSPADLADPPLPVPLASLSKLEDRHTPLAETMRRAGAIASKADSPQPPAPGADPEFDRRLADDAIDNEPLYLMMAGTEAVQSGAPAALRLTRTDLAMRAAARERARLEHLAAQWTLPPALLTHLALCVTLQGGCDPQAAEDLLREEGEALSLLSPLPLLETIQKLAEAMPAATTGEIDALRPDLVGEAFVLDVMRTYRGFPAKEQAIIARAWQRAPAEVAATLVRTAQDFSRGDSAHETVRRLDAQVDGIRNLGDLLAFLAALPAETIALREVAANTNFRAVNLARTFKHDPNATPYLAFLLARLAVRLGAVGRREESLEAAREAADIYRGLAAQRPDEFRPHLAMSLNNLANGLSMLGQREAVIVVAREAAAVYRELASQRPDEFRPPLAMSLNNLANGLSMLGQHEAALDAAREAVEISYELAAQWPDVSLPDLAMSLNTLADCLGDVGQQEEALRVAREGTNVFRELAARRPDAFRPELAKSLNTLANSLNEIERCEEARDAVSEAVEVLNELAAKQPNAFLPDLAMSLNNLAITLIKTGQREAALGAARGATEAYSSLAAQRPDAFLPSLAKSLAVQANCLSDSSLHVEAQEKSAEAVDTFAMLFFVRPLLFAGPMAQTLHDHLAHCDAAGREPDAERLNPIIQKLNELSGGKP